MTKQTAVEWLINHWKKLQSEGEKMSCNQIIQITELAKEMEKEQIVKAVSKGWNYHEDGFVSWMGEQYYNETYGGTNNV